MARILLVEDDPILRRLYEVNLTNAGFAVTLASDGLDALDKLQTSIPDVILCDISMPRMDGFTFRTKLAEDPDLRNIAFLFLTARSSEEDMLKGISLDADDYIIKTAGPAMVIAKVKSILRRRTEIASKLTDELASASTESSVLLIPKHAPSVDGWEITFIHRPHQGVPGGDFIDFVDLKDGKWLITLADVMGKRWRAWMFAHAYIAYIRSMIRAFSQNEKPTPGGLLTRLNHSIFQDSKTADVLCTTLLVSLEQQRKEVLISNAAHLHPVCQRKSSGEIEIIGDNTIFLGFLEDSLYVDTLVELETGDRLFLFTDGLTEATNPNGVQFGSEAVVKVLAGFQAMPLRDVPKAVIEHIAGFTGHDSFDDDFTLICIEKS